MVQSLKRRALEQSTHSVLKAAQGRQPLGLKFLIMENVKRGGSRDGSGRPSTDRHRTLSVRISDESWKLLEGCKNKSMLIDTLIKAFYQ